MSLEVVIVLCATGLSIIISIGICAIHDALIKIADSIYYAHKGSESK